MSHELFLIVLLQVLVLLRLTPLLVDGTELLYHVYVWNFELVAAGVDAIDPIGHIELHLT